MTFRPSEILRATTYLTKVFERGKSVKIEPITQPKTLSQVRYLWLILTHVGTESGNSKEDLYQLCLNKFPVTKEIEFNGEISQIPVTLSAMTKEQGIAFIDNVSTFFRQEGFDVPSPEDERCKQMIEYYNERGMM